MTELQRKYLALRDEWMEQVTEKCHEYALSLDKDFYVFQTDCARYQPEILIIGINPGGGKTYSTALKELKKEGFERRPASSLKYDINTLTTKPKWEVDKGANTMRDRLSRVFNEDTKLKSKLEAAVMMNMYYFNTEAASELKSVSEDARRYCLDKTLEFIEILNPKNILFLTSDEKLLRRAGLRNFNFLGNNVKQAELTNQRVFCIPHYSYYAAYSYDKADLMGKKLFSCLS